MEPRLGLLEEVQSEADGGEAEEEELWVRGCTAFPMNRPVSKTSTAPQARFRQFFCLVFSYSFYTATLFLSRLLP